MKKVRYDKESQAMYVSVSEGKIDHSEELTGDIILDRTKDGELVGIDILNVDLPKELGKPGRLTEKIRTIARSMITASHYNQLDDTTFDNYLLEMLAQYDQRGELGMEEINLDDVESMSHFGVIRDWLIKLKGGRKITLGAGIIKNIVEHENKELGKPGELLSPKELRDWAKSKLCSGCTGTRQSGSYFSNGCKDTAPTCRRISDFVSGAQAQLDKCMRGSDESNTQ